jgi:TM2 domain-containing membrane protein YozV
MNNSVVESLDSKKPSVSPILIAIAVVAILRGVTSIYCGVNYVLFQFPTFGIDVDAHFIVFSFVWFFCGILALAAAFFAFKRAGAMAGFALLASVLIGDVLVRIVLFVGSLIEGWSYQFDLPGGWVFGSKYVDVASAISDFSFYPAVILGILAVVSQAKPGKVPTLVSPLGLVPSPASTEYSVAESTQTATQTKGTKMAETKQWEVMIPGAADAKVDTASLAMWAQAGTVKPDTMVKEIATGAVFPARQIPGVFSDKSYITALLISFFLGVLGIDRFYTGHTGLGIGKLLTGGGCGVWALIDFILFAMRKVTDSNGRPLQ